MKKNFVHSIVCILLLMIVSCTDKNQPSPASITYIDSVGVVSLYGTWEQMGEQYGELAGTHLKHVQSYLQTVIGDDAAKRDSIVNMANQLYSPYPHRFKQFFAGMAKTSGLTMDQLIMNNAVEYAEGFFCSGIAAWDDYTSGDVVYGRNYDAFSYDPIAQDILVTVFHPSDGALATAIIGYAGEVYAVNAINEKGIFMELNNGMPSAGWKIDFERFAATTSLLEMMFNAYDLDYVDAFFRSSLSSASFIIGVADDKEARSYEFCSEGAHNATDANPKGLMVQTNHYVSTKWSFPTPTDETGWNSLTRRQHLLDLAENHKGRIDESTMCTIISTPIDQGGAMQDITQYQLVYTPKTKHLLIRIAQGPQWTQVDLNAFF